MSSPRKRGPRATDEPVALDSRFRGNDTEWMRGRRTRAGLCHLRLRRLLFARGSSSLARQPDGEDRADLDRAVDVDGAAMLLDDLAHGRQAEADTEALGGEERLEDLGQAVLRYARPIVSDGDAHMRAGRLRAHGDGALAIVGRRPALVGQGLGRVV